MRKTIWLLTALCLSGTTLSAAPITKQRAQQIAAEWLKTKNPSLQVQAPAVMKTDVVLGALTPEGDPYLYAVSNGPSGYVLVSGDDRAPAVLGYTAYGSYDESQLPDNMRSWLQHYIDELALLQQYNLSSPQQDAMPDLGDPIAKTTTSLWDQLTPYNRECPMVETFNDEDLTQVRREPLRAATGCAATALAQVLYMYREEYAKPETKEGKLTQDIPARTGVVYKSAELEDDMKTQVPVWLRFSDEAIPATTTIDWANLIDVYSERNAEGKYATDDTNVKGTPEQQAAVAKLMHICAAISDMQYGTIYSGGSGTYSFSTVKGAALYLGFENARLQEQNEYSYEDWVRALYQELQKAKCVYFGGSSSSGGHAFVIDGYLKEDLFHVNWGWSGLANETTEDGGYYRINSLLPVNQGTGGAIYNDGYRMQQVFYTGLYPNAPKPAGEIPMRVSILNTDQRELPVNDGKLLIYLYTATANQSAPVIEAEIGVSIENEQGYKQVVPIGEGIKKYYLTEMVGTDQLMSWTGLSDGDYVMHMYYRTSADGEWMLCDKSDRSFIKLNVSQGKATLRNSGLYEVELLSHDVQPQYQQGQDITFNLKYKLTKGTLGGLILSSYATPAVVNEDGYLVPDNSQDAPQAAPAMIMVQEGEEFTVTGTFAAATLKPGDYVLICGGPAGLLATDINFRVVESTAIRLPQADGPAATETWYDLEGRQLPAKPQAPGIYITGGRRVVVK